MVDFLTPVSTTTVRRSKSPEPLLEATTTKRSVGITEHVDISTPEQISKALKNQPDFPTVSKILKSLANNKDGFNLIVPGPVSAQIVDTLVNNTIPDYWNTFKEERKVEKDLISCLRNANGIGAILSRLRPLIADCRQKKRLNNTRDPSAHIKDLLDVLEKILAGDNTRTRRGLLNGDYTSHKIAEDIWIHGQNPTQKKLMWREYVTQVASGRILSAVAEAEDVLKERGSSRTASWVASGPEYASWLGRNLAVIMDEGDWKEAVTDLFAKALGLGYLGLFSIPQGSCLC